MQAKALSVTIVGAGIGGLAAANALLQHGVNVHVYEQAPNLSEVGAGISLAPNGARALRGLGFGAEIDRLGSQMGEGHVLHADGTMMAPTRSGLEGKIDQYGFHRADLLGMLASRLPGDIVRTGFRCIGFEQDADQAIAIGADGQRIAADVVIGADGIHSRLQGFVVEPSAPVFSGTIAYRGVIPAASVGWSSDTRRTWLGDGKFFLAYPVRGGELLCYVAFLPTDEEMKESWSAPGDPAVLAQECAGWDPVLQGVIAKVKTTFRWGLYDRVPLERWTQGRLTLLGDAAHPMLPHAGQGANQAIEDGVALAILLAGATSESVPEALLAYEALRRERTAQIQRMARRRGAAKMSAIESARTGELEQVIADPKTWVREYDIEAETKAFASARGYI